MSVVETVGLLRASRAFMGARPKRPRVRKVLPRDRFPQLIANEYTAALWRLIERWRVAFEPLERELPGIIAQARAERGDAAQGAADAAAVARGRCIVRTDGDEGKRVSALVEQARANIAGAVSTEELDRVAKLFAERTATQQRIALLKQSRAALGMDVFVSDRGVAGAIDRFVAHNVALIKDIPLETARKIEQRVLAGVSGGTLQGDLAKVLGEEFGFAKERAALIANDQIGKAYGQIGAIRHKEMGVDAFFWRTANDRRVRGTPGGKYPKAKPSHYHRNGVRYLYSDPPKGRHGEPELPGEPVRCRCTGEPDFSSLLDSLE